MGGVKKAVVTPVSNKKESLLPPSNVVTSMDTPCSARSCGLFRESRSRLARRAIGVLPINTSMELSITLSISTLSTGLSGTTAMGNLLLYFVKKRFLKHPVYNLFDSLGLFA